MPCAAARDSSAMACPRATSVGRNIPLTNAARHYGSSSARTASMKSRKNALASSFMIGTESTTPGRGLPLARRAHQPNQRARLGPNSTDWPSPAAAATASTSSASTTML
jgi:hypothetical protein